MYDSDKYPYSYRAFGMYVRSQFPVRIFEPCETYNSDIVIREGI